MLHMLKKKSRQILLLVLVCLLNFFVTNTASCANISIGVSEFPRDINLLTSDNPAAEFSKLAMTSTLLRKMGADKQGFKLVISNAINIDSSGKKWNLRLSPLVTFANGQRILSADVIYSLKRCVAISGSPDFNVELIKNSDPRIVEQEWIGIEYVGQNSISELSDLVTNCPLIEAKSSELFGADLGIGSNLVGSGLYALTSFKAGKEIILSRTQTRYKDSSRFEQLEQIVIRGFKEESQALSALRSGTIDALVATNSEIIESAQKDETLSLSACQRYTIVRRKGLQLSCPHELDVAEIRYTTLN